MTLDSARRAVFDTNELLENILSYLPSSELFMLQSVSKQWRGVMSSSPGLQERMFLRSQSSTAKETWTLDGYNRSVPFRKISAYQRYTERAGVPKFRRVHDDKAGNGIFLSPLTLNPILHLADFVQIPDSGSVIKKANSPFTMSRPCKGIFADLAAVQRICCASADAASTRVRPVALRRQCSLWNVYLSDPPCRVARVKIVVKYQGPQPYRLPAPDSWAGFHVKSDAGITFGDILLAASSTGMFNCCEFDDGYVWKDLRTEMKEMIDDAAAPSGWMSMDEVEEVTLHIQLVQDGKVRPVVVTEEDRAAVISEEPQAAMVTN
jgi:hypothetical protein